MGCGSSSLKGEKVNEVIGEEKPQPIKKVQTNFSDVDYNSASQTRRNTEYAPDTVRRPTTIEEHPVPGLNATTNASTGPSLTVPGTSQSTGDTAVPTQNFHYTPDVGQGQHGKLEPYRSIEGENDGLNSPVVNRDGQVYYSSTRPEDSVVDGGKDVMAGQAPTMK